MRCFCWFEYFLEYRVPSFLKKIAETSTEILSDRRSLDRDYIIGKSFSRHSTLICYFVLEYKSITFGLSRYIAPWNHNAYQHDDAYCYLAGIQLACCSLAATSRDRHRLLRTCPVLWNPLKNKKKLLHEVS